MRFEVSSTWPHLIELAAIDEDGHRYPAGRLWPVDGEPHEAFRARADVVVEAMNRDPGACPDCGMPLRRVHPFGTPRATLVCECGYEECEITAEEIARDFPGVVR